MNLSPWIAPATQSRLANPAPPGGRHAQIVKLAAALVAQGFNPEAIFCQLRPNYGPDMSDAEIRAVISWAKGRFSGAGAFSASQTWRPFPKTFGVSPKTPNNPVSAIERFLDGFRCEEVDLWEKSPIRLEWDFPKDARFLLSVLYRPDENVNIIAEFGLLGGKGHPIGRGWTKKRQEWAALFERNGPPNGKMGVWVRPNPTDGEGVSDANIVHHRFLLVEFDAVSLALQLPFLARLALPISAIITSGGKSLHAWVRIDAGTISEYRTASERIFTALEPYGIDPANKNPGRLSRLPGVTRNLGAGRIGLQKLL